MTKQLPDNALKNAKAAVDNARRVREYHRRRTETDSPQREADIKIALDRISEAMKPLRSEIGRFPYAPQTEQIAREQDRIRSWSEALQTERRKLWKMRRKDHGAKPRP